MKLKYCGSGEHEVAKLWRAKTKTTQSACYDCARRQNPVTIKKVPVKACIEPTKEKKHYVIPKISDKQKKINAAYKILRDQFIKNNPYCIARFEGCTHIATECHHARGRGKEYMLDETTYRALCHHCHSIAETNPKLAKSLNISQSRLDKSA